MTLCTKGSLPTASRFHRGAASSTCKMHHSLTLRPNSPRKTLDAQTQACFQIHPRAASNSDLWRLSTRDLKGRSIVAIKVFRSQTSRCSHPLPTPIKRITTILRCFSTRAKPRIYNSSLPRKVAEIDDSLCTSSTHKPWQMLSRSTSGAARVRATATFPLLAMVAEHVSTRSISCSCRKLRLIERKCSTS